MNNFAGDPNCKALWRFENGALTVDSKDGNHLTTGGAPIADLVKFKEGAASVELQAIGADRYSITDALLGAGFPLKNGDAVKKISVTFWARFISVPSIGVYQFCFIKGTYGGNDNSILIVVEGTAGGAMMELWISANGIAWTAYAHASPLVINRWYHVGVTYQDSDQVYRIRIWDDTAGAILGVDKTGVGINVHIDAGGLYISNSTIGQKLDANLDELVVFNDILGVGEIDAIRAGTYDVGKPPVFGGLNRKRCPLNAQQKVGMLAEL